MIPEVKQTSGDKMLVKSQNLPFVSPVKHGQTAGGCPPLSHKVSSGFSQSPSAVKSLLYVVVSD